MNFRVLVFHTDYVKAHDGSVDINVGYRTNETVNYDTINDVYM